MFKKIKSLLKRAAEKKPFDPSTFDDSLALETEWNPLKRGGTNFRTHKLIKVNYNRIEFKSTLGAKAFSLLFIAFGIGIPGWIGYGMVQASGELFQKDFLLTLLFGLIFLGVGVALFYSYAKPVIFDKTKGMFWKGWTPPNDIWKKRVNKTAAESVIFMLSSLSPNWYAVKINRTSVTN